MIDQLLRMKLAQEGLGDKVTEVKTDLGMLWNHACIIRRGQGLEVILGPLDPALVPVATILKAVISSIRDFPKELKSWHYVEKSDGVWITHCFEKE